MTLRIVAPSEEFFHGMELNIVTESPYLGGFIGDGATEKSCPTGRVEGWAESVGNLEGVSRKHPQSSYAGLKKSLQKEWAFVQRVTPGIGNAFCPLEKALQENFLPDLFEGLEEGAPERGVTRLPVKEAGLSPPYLTLTSPENWMALCIITVQIVAALRCQVEFWTADHLACLQEGQTEVRKRSAQRVNRHN